MALSDACFEFLETVSSAAQTLAQEVHHYSNPEYPIRYGSEIDALRRACFAVKDAPYDPEAGARLLRLAASAMAFLDASPNTTQAKSRETAMKELIRVLGTEFDGDDSAAVPSLVRNVVTETSYTRIAAARLKELLPKLGKTGYEIVVKIVSDVGAATAKKVLGL